MTCRQQGVKFLGGWGFTTADQHHTVVLGQRQVRRFRKTVDNHNVGLRPELVTNAEKAGVRRDVMPLLVDPELHIRYILAKKQKAA
jgi:hypothetical protein